jgi:hypothetical protein
MRMFELLVVGAEANSGAARRRLLAGQEKTGGLA